MAVLRDVARQILLLTLAQFGLLLLLATGSVMPPEQRSLLPPSFCVARPEFYQQIGLLDFFFVPAAVGAVSLAGLVACHNQVAGAGAGAGAGGAPKAMLRALTLLAVALSATAAGLAMAASVLVLQVKAGKLVCQAGAVRFSVYASYVVVVPVLLLCYIDLARMTVFSK